MRSSPPSGFFFLIPSPLLPKISSHRIPVFILLLPFFPLSSSLGLVLQVKAFFFLQLPGLSAFSPPPPGIRFLRISTKGLVGCASPNFSCISQLLVQQSVPRNPPVIRSKERESDCFFCGLPYIAILQGRTRSRDSSKILLYPSYVQYILRPAPILAAHLTE